MSDEMETPATSENRHSRSASASESKLAPSTILLGVIAIAVVGAVAFYFGRTMPARQMAQRPAAANVTRLPAKQFDSWTLDCIVNAQKAKQCSLALRAVNDKKQLVMSLAVARGPKGNAGLLIVTPPSAILPAGVRLTADSNPQITAKFITCGPRACEAQIPLDDSLRQQIAAAQTLNVSYTAGNGRAVGYKLPVKGFEAGYTALMAEYPSTTPSLPSSP